MLTPILKPWSGITRDFRTYRTEDKLEHGVFEKQVDTAIPTPGVISIIVTVPEETDLKSGHVAHRMAGIVESSKSLEWRVVDTIVWKALNRLSTLHGLGSREHHHVASAHTGRFHAHPDHITEDLLAEYLLTGNVALNASGGAIKVDDGKRKWTAYAQPGHADGTKEVLAQFPGQFKGAADELLNSLTGKLLVA